MVSVTTTMQSERVDGIDVSHWQEVIDWPKVAKAGAKFAFAKATEGKSIVDKCFITNWNGIRQTGKLSAGAYHYYHTDCTNEEQLSAIKSHVFDAIDFDPSKDMFAVDFEKNLGRVSKATAASRLHSFLLAIESQFNVKPLLYTSPDFWLNNIGTAYTSYNFESYRLWIANYNTSSPTIPKPWTDYYIWQFTETGKYSGIDPSNNVDLNRYA